ncbi:MAG: Hsp20/alpha crystallin family protein [Saprospiraceae bacterium]|nr:Hsp20/alpha crystallin family protein [Saprospiraceae bacterium]MCB9326758.1 Hsp20/alpha crystallin family protein [Lewinellaceae bacterium]
MGALVKWNESNFPTFSSMFDDFFKTEFPVWSHNNFAAEGATLPAVNIKETDKEFGLELAAPGMSKEDFKVAVEDDVLTISAEKEFSKEDKKDNYNRREFSYSSFQRRFNLPESIEADKVTAKYKDGVLHVSLPKKPEAQPKPAKTIKIS